MSQTRAQIAAEIAAKIVTGGNTRALAVREAVQDIALSAPNIADDGRVISVGAASAGKYPILDGSGKLDASMIPGGGGGGTWGSIIGTLSAQTDLQNALNLKAPLDAPHFTNQVQINGGLYAHNSVAGVDELTLSPDAAVFGVPIAENIREITDSDDPSVLISDLVVDYKRTDSSPLAVADVDFGGQHLTILNSSSNSVVLNGVGAESFFNGSLGPVPSITLQPREVIYFMGENGPSSTTWRVISRYFELLETISVSTGPSDAGKIPITDGSGLLDPSFLGGGASASDRWSVLTAAEIAITGAGTATVNRGHLCTGTSYTVTMPSASVAGSFCSFRMGTASTLTGLVTINGDVFWSDETVEYIASGGVWKILTIHKIQMRCLMAPSGTTSVATATAQKIDLVTAAIDNTGRMADSTNKRINFIRAGTYIVTAYVRSSSLGTAICPRWISATEKNGVATFFTQGECSILVGGFCGATVPSPNVYAAGDFIELFNFQTSGFTQTAGGTGTTEDTHLSVIEQLG